MKTLGKNMGRILSVGIMGVALMALGVLGIGAALAEEGESDSESGRCRGSGSGRLMSMAADLELDEDQTARLETVRELVREQRRDRRGRGGPGFEIVSEALETGELDPDEIHARIDESLDAKRATAHAVADEMIAFFESLDEDQRAAMAAQIEERQGERSERRARRGHCRGEADGDCPYGRGGRHGRGGPPAVDEEE